MSEPVEVFADFGALQEQAQRYLRGLPELPSLDPPPGALSIEAPAAIEAVEVPGEWPADLGAVRSAYGATAVHDDQWLREQAQHVLNGLPPLPADPIYDDEQPAEAEDDEGSP